MSSETTLTELGTDNDAGPERPRRRGTRLRWLGLSVLVLAGAGTGYWYYVGLEEPADATGVSTAPVKTAEVTRATIADTRSFSGTLGHGDAFTVTTSDQGVVTGIADQGTDVERGTELFRINEQPVTALYGVVPMYRGLQVGDTGVDVEQLEDNLAKLGYDGFDVDEEFTSWTEAAVREWQNDIGAEETGVVAQTDVVFVPKGNQVDTLHVEVGSVLTQGGPVLDRTSSDQVVSLEVEVRDRDLLSVDTEVTVELPGGEEVAGTVTSASVVPVGSGDGSDDSSSEGTITEVEVTLEETVDEALLGATADVVIQVDRREDVLTVPVNGLLALAEGGHGVAVVADDGTSSIVPVETGLFADGRVEVSGSGIEESTVVGVAGR